MKKAAFVQKYGEERYNRLISMLKAGESGQKIADEFGVTRECARQWRNALGRTVTVYLPWDDVLSGEEGK